jgi:hypothetical protein
MGTIRVAVGAQTALVSSRLFDALPTTRRKLLVRPGAVDWWGVDSSTKRIAIGCISAEGERKGAIESVPTLEGAPRVEAIRLATARLCERLCLDSVPGVIVVEEAAAFGARPNPELAYAVGAVLCGLAGALPGTRVEFVASSKWKREVCGYGGIKKPKPTDREPYRALVWAREQGYEGTSWDEADAWAIAEYARLAYVLEPR